MKDNYQIGSSEEWLKHSNEELARMLKKRERQMRWLRLLVIVLLLALGWVVFKLLHAGGSARDLLRWR